VISPSPQTLPAGHAEIGASPSAIRTNTMISSIVTAPFPLQSPGQRFGVGEADAVGVGDGSGVEVEVSLGVGVAVGVSEGVTVADSVGDAVGVGE
jgi:hypothetical protein